MMSFAPNEEYWNSDEYLKRNAAGAHSNSKLILAEMEQMKESIAEANSRLDRLLTIVVLGMAIFFLILIFGHR